MAIAAMTAILEGGASGWTVTGLALLAAGGVLGQQLLSWSKDRRARLERIERALVRWPLTATEADPSELRIERSATAERYTWSGDAAPYVPRDEDRELREALREHRFVLVVGPPNAGKSRTALEAIRDPEGGFAARGLIVPRRPSDGDRPHPLRDLAALDPPLPVGKMPAVLWLDDIDEYLLAGELDVALLNDWQQGSPPRAVVLATIRDGQLDALLAPSSEKRREAGAIGKAIDAVLERAIQVRLDSELSGDEIDRGIERYPDLDFSRDGIGARLVDAQRLLDRLRRARSVHPTEFAVVRATADCQRAGMLRPVKKSDLEALLLGYPDSIRSNMDQAIAWGEEKEESGTALLQHDGDAGYTVPDFIVDECEGRLPDSGSYQPIPAATWEHVIRGADAEELLAVGLSAYFSPDPSSRRAARDAWSKALSAGHPNASPSAAVNLGNLLAEQGDAQGARGAYQRAIDSGHADEAPKAAFNLGKLLAEQGDAQGARGAYQRAIDSGHADAAPWAAASLGELLRGQGDPQGARRAYQRAIDSGHADAAPWAAFNLGNLLAEQGDPQGARAPTSARSTPATPTGALGGVQSRVAARGARRCAGCAARLPARDRLRPRRRGP